MKAVSIEEAVAMIPNGASIMVGGFMGVGTPDRLLDELVRTKKSGFALISNDAARPGQGVGKLFDGAQVSRMIGTHIGLNPKAQHQMLGKQITVDLIPQGTFVERIRAGGCGLGGVLTPTGVGTLVEEGKQKIDVNGKTFLLETALRADFALVHAFLADYARQPLLCSYRAQLQSGDGDGRRHGDCHRRTYRSGRRHRARPCRDPGAAGRLPRRERVTHGRTNHYRPPRGARSFGPATSSISASVFRRWSRTTCQKG